jgi:hypothetical protein
MRKQLQVRKASYMLCCDAARPTRTSCRHHSLANAMRQCEMRARRAPRGREMQRLGSGRVPNTPLPQLPLWCSGRIWNDLQRR